MAEKIELDLKVDDLQAKLLQAEAAYERVREKEKAAQRTERLLDEVQRKGFQVGQKKEGQTDRFAGKVLTPSPIQAGLGLTAMIPGIGPTIAGHAKGLLEATGFSVDILIPILKGLLKEGLLSSILKELGIGVDAVEAAISKHVSGGLSAVQDTVNKFRAWDDAFRPTWERMKDIARLRSLAGTTFNTADASKMFSFLFDLNKAETTMKMKMDQRGREMLVRSLAGSIEASMHE